MKTFIVQKIKTIVLLVLILSSMSLTYRLWFKGHNLFSISGFFEKGDKKIKSENVLEHVYLPPKILFNLDKEAHEIILATDNQYKSFQKEGSQIIKKILSSETYDVLELSNWNELLSSRSMLFGYETDIDSQLLAKLLKVEKVQNGIKSISEFIVVQDSTESNNIRCFVKDKSLGKIYAVKFNYDDTNLTQLILQFENNNEFHNYVTAHEMKYNLLKDDILLLPIDAQLYGKIVILFNEINLQSSSDVNNIAKHFFENYHIVKNIEYMNSSKTKVVQKEFIDRKSIFKLFDNGKIEYSTADLPSKNVDIDVYSSLQIATEFIESSLGFPENAYISEIKKVSDSHYLFGFDYMIDGLKVKLKGEDIPKHAIEVEVRGNIISSYKRFVKEYRLGREQELKVTSIKAIDRAITRFRRDPQNKEKKISISQVELVYVNNEYTRQSHPFWFIVIEGAPEPYKIDSINEELF